MSRPRRDNDASGDPAPDEGCRLDIWLYRTRLTKTRREAQKLIIGRKVRLTRSDQTQRVTKPHFTVRAGDQLSFMRARTLHHIEVIGAGERRGPATEARTLYHNLLSTEDDAAQS